MLFCSHHFYVFDVVAVGVDCSAANREGLLRRADPGGGPCMEGQNRTVANTGELCFKINMNIMVDCSSETKKNGLFLVFSLPTKILLDLCQFLQVSLVAEERDQNISRVQELEASVTELKNAAGERFF